MRIGINNTSIPYGNKITEIFEKCRLLGFNLVELNLNSFPVTFRKERVDKIKNLAKINTLDLSVHAAIGFMEFCHKDKFIQEVSLNLLKANLMQADWINAKYFIFHVGKCRTIDDQINKLQDFVDFSKKYKPKILFENSPSGFGSSEKEIEKVLETLKVDMNMDIGHLWISVNNNKASLETINKFRDKIKYAHVHTNFGKKDEHLPLTSGNLPLKEMIGKLLNTKVECFTLECRSTPEELIESRDILKNIVNKLSPYNF